MELWRRRQVRVRRGPWNFLSAAAMTAWLALPLPALAQDNVVATATLPRDLSVWGMFVNANPVVQAVMIGLVFASVVTWTVWLAKLMEEAMLTPRHGATFDLELPIQFRIR